MSYAIELYFDPDSEKKIRTIWEEVSYPEFYSSDRRPHISIALFRTLNAPKLEEKIKKFAEDVPRMELSLSSVGTFPGEEGVLFLAPKVTEQLLAVNCDFHELFTDAKHNMVSHYFSENWVPHCTVAIFLSPEELSKSMRLLLETYRYETLTVKLASIGVMEYPSLKRMMDFPLG